MYACAVGIYSRLDTLLPARKDGLEGADSRGAEGVLNRAGVLGTAQIHTYGTRTYTFSHTHTCIQVHSHSWQPIAPGLLSMHWSC